MVLLLASSLVFSLLLLFPQSGAASFSLPFGRWCFSSLLPPCIFKTLPLYQFTVDKHQRGRRKATAPKGGTQRIPIGERRTTTAIHKTSGESSTIQKGRGVVSAPPRSRRRQPHPKKAARPSLFFEGWRCVPFLLLWWWCCFPPFFFALVLLSSLLLWGCGPVSPWLVLSSSVLAWCCLLPSLYGWYCFPPVSSSFCP